MPTRPTARAPSAAIAARGSNRCRRPAHATAATVTMTAAIIRPCTAYSAAAARPAPTAHSRRLRGRCAASNPHRPISHTQVSGYSAFSLIATWERTVTLGYTAPANAGPSAVRRERPAKRVRSRCSSGNRHAARAALRASTR